MHVLSKLCGISKLLVLTIQSNENNKLVHYNTSVIKDSLTYNGVNYVYSSYI